MVNDIAIQEARLVQIVQRLLDGVGATGAVSAHSQRVMRLNKSQVMVHVWELLAGDFVSHEVGIYLLGPHVIKPSHGHQVTKPHV